MCYVELIQVELKAVLLKNKKFRPKKKVRNIFKKVEINKVRNIQSQQISEGVGRNTKNHSHSNCQKYFNFKKGRVISGDFVTTEDGTGIVHTAPAHGLEDFHASNKYKLEILNHVGSDGRFLETAFDFSMSDPQRLGSLTLLLVFQWCVIVLWYDYLSQLHCMPFRVSCIACLSMSIHP